MKTPRFFSLCLLAATPLLADSKLEYDEVLVYQSGTSERADSYGVRQYRIPHLTQGPDGELVVCVAGRTNKAGDNGKTTSGFAVSKDGGSTWEHIRFESDYSKPTPKGEFPMCHRTNEVQVEWVPQLKKYVALYCDHFKCYLIQSNDLKIWGEPKLIPFQDDFQKAWPSPSSFHIEQDGTMCFNMITIKKGQEASDRRAQTFWTKDGVRFETSGQAPTVTGECNLMKMTNGHYLYVGRARQRAQNRLLYTYDRENKQWGEARSLPVPTHYSCQQDLLIDGKNIYLSAPLGPARKNGVIYLSQDLGQTWKEHHRMPKDLGFGYSSMTLMKGGKIGLLFEKRTREQGLLDEVFTTFPTAK